MCVNLRNSTDYLITTVGSIRRYRIPWVDGGGSSGDIVFVESDYATSVTDSAPLQMAGSAVFYSECEELAFRWPLFSRIF